MSLFELDGKGGVRFSCVEPALFAKLSDILATFADARQSLPTEVVFSLDRLLTRSLESLHSCRKLHGCLSVDHVIVSHYGGVLLLQPSNQVASPLSCFNTPYGAALTPEHDMFALGCVLYTAVAGSVPFHGESVEELRQSVRVGPAALVTADAETRRLILFRLRSGLPPDLPWIRVWQAEIDAEMAAAASHTDTDRADREAAELSALAGASVGQESNGAAFESIPMDELLAAMEGDGDLPPVDIAPPITAAVADLTTASFRGGASNEMTAKGSKLTTPRGSAATSGFSSGGAQPGRTSATSAAGTARSTARSSGPAVPAAGAGASSRAASASIAAGAAALRSISGRTQQTAPQPPSSPTSASARSRGSQGSAASAAAVAASAPAIGISSARPLSRLSTGGGSGRAWVSPVDAQAAVASGSSGSGSGGGTSSAAPFEGDTPSAATRSFGGSGHRLARTPPNAAAIAAATAAVAAASAATAAQTGSSSLVASPSPQKVEAGAVARETATDIAARGTDSVTPVGSGNRATGGAVSTGSRSAESKSSLGAPAAFAVSSHDAQRRAVEPPPLLPQAPSAVARVAAAAAPASAASNGGGAPSASGAGGSGGATRYKRPVTGSVDDHVANPVIARKLAALAAVDAHTHIHMTDATLSAESAARASIHAASSGAAGGLSRGASARVLATGAVESAHSALDATAVDDGSLSGASSVAGAGGSSIISGGGSGLGTGRASLSGLGSAAGGGPGPGFSQGQLEYEAALEAARREAYRERQALLAKHAGFVKPAAPAAASPPAGWHGSTNTGAADATALGPTASPLLAPRGSGGSSSWRAEGGPGGLESGYAMARSASPGSGPGGYGGGAGGPGGYAARSSGGGSTRFAQPDFGSAALAPPAAGSSGWLSRREAPAGPGGYAESEAVPARYASASAAPVLSVARGEAEAGHLDAGDAYRPFSSDPYGAAPSSTCTAAVSHTASSSAAAPPAVGGPAGLQAQLRQQRLAAEQAAHEQALLAARKQAFEDRLALEARFGRGRNSMR